jgi:hypothetical protein
LAAVTPMGLATSTGSGTTGVTATMNGLNATAVLGVHRQTVLPQGPVHASNVRRLVPMVERKARLSTPDW